MQHFITLTKALTIFNLKNLKWVPFLNCRCNLEALDSLCMTSSLTRSFRSRWAILTYLRKATASQLKWVSRENISMMTFLSGNPFCKKIQSFFFIKKQIHWSSKKKTQGLTNTSSLIWKNKSELTSRESLWKAYWIFHLLTKDFLNKRSLTCQVQCQKFRV